ncbi:Adenosine deaminase 2 [Pseudocercospora fuligena]|uniref:Adenosine deaminase 2 n=1 Tax=Pseudocercospora fuligena TaxID=685502 RepID=A0A8H6RNB0_9PEZI|nr:Adenosine deaminase 2 [Pseudocercospora fuligena]
MLREKIKRRRFQQEKASAETKSPSDNSEDLAHPEQRRKLSLLPLLCGKRTQDRRMSDSKPAARHSKPSMARPIPNHDEYELERSRLLEDERGQLWYKNVPRASSSTETSANAIITRIREDERIGLFGEMPSEAVPADDLRDLGGRFLVNKERIDKSDLLQIAKRMPKGTHLHLHFNTQLPPERLIAHARKLADTMYIRSDRHLSTADNFNQAEIVFEVRPNSTLESDIFSLNYDPLPVEGNKKDFSRSWMRWSTFRHAFPKGVDLKSIETETGWQDIPEEHCQDHLDYHKLDNAERWAREKMIVTRHRAYHDRQTTNGAWACFNQGTRAFKGLLNYKSIYRWYIGEMIQSLIDDKIMYAELRPMLLDKTIPSDDGMELVDHSAQMKIVLEEVQKKLDELQWMNKLDDFPFGLKIIYCTPRSISPELMTKELQNCLDLKKRYPHLICGFDLVGAEDRPKNIGAFAKELVDFTHTCENEGVSVPFMFHAGETLLDTGGTQDPDNSNLYDALLLQSKRIGHGYSLLKHPLLVQKYKAADICLEVCPTSNELLHLCGNVRQHILPELLAAGLHCTLNADNPNLFSNSLSYEFYQVMAGDPRMNLYGWKQLALWSIEHACLNSTEQQRAKEIFDRRWQEFCDWVVDTYGQSLATSEVPAHATQP